MKFRGSGPGQDFPVSGVPEFLKSGGPTWLIDGRNAVRPVEGKVAYGSDTLRGINISHLGKRKIIFKTPFLGDMLVPWRVSTGF